MEEYPSNSKTTQASTRANASPEKKVEKLVTGEVIRRKPSLGKRFSNTFLGGDAKGVGQRVVLDVLLPAVKDIVTDATSAYIEGLIFGESRPRRGSSGGFGGGRPGGTSYTNYGNRAPSATRRHVRDDPRGTPVRTTRSESFDEIILATRVEAEQVIDRMFDLVSQYGTATVADLYSIVGISASFTDANWGWTNMEGSSASRTRTSDGAAYILNLPRPEALG